VEPYNIANFLLLTMSSIPLSYDSATKAVYLPEDFNEPFDSTQLPVDTEKLYLGSNFFQKLSPNMFPPNLTHLFMSDYIPQIEPGVLLSTITHIEMGINYNFELSRDILPLKLKYLKMSDKYSFEFKPDTFPQELECLVLGYNYDIPILPGTLPSSLKCMEFNWNYKQLIEPGVFPEGLVDLKLGHCYNELLTADTLPKTLESISFGWYYSKILCDEFFPASVRKINVFDNNNNNFAIKNISSFENCIVKKNLGSNTHLNQQPILPNS